MKKFFTSFWLVIALTFSTPSLLLMPPTTALLAGCTSGCKTANTVAYKGTASVAVTVDAAMKAWGDYVAANHPPAAQEAAVKAAFEKYQSAALAVTSAGAAHAKALATQGADPTTAQSTLNAAIAISSAALADLISLLKQFGVKI